MADSDSDQAVAESDEQPPAFASWRVLYSLALASALLAMLAIAAFSSWDF